MENPWPTKKQDHLIKRSIVLTTFILIIVLLLISILILLIIRFSHRRTTITVNENGREKKVLFVIADGIPADLIEKLSLENLRKIESIGQYRRAYVGGENGSYTETATISAPGYMNLITGTWGNKHNVYDNDVDKPNYNYKNLFRLLKENHLNKSIGIFSSWIDNRLKLVGEGLQQAGKIFFDFKFDGYELDQSTYPHDSDRFYIHLIDERVINESSQCIERYSPDLSWIYLEYTDDVAHLYGDSEQFQKAILLFDQQINRIWKSIQYRINSFNEDWLLILTTDHGRDLQTGKSHGEQSERERTTWIVTNYRQMNSYFHRYQPAIVDIYPTIAKFLDLNIPLELKRELDGIPLIEKVSLIQPRIILIENQLTLTWKALDNAGNVTFFLSTTNLFREGLKDNYIFIGSIPITTQMATFNIDQYPSNFYKIVFEGTFNTVNRWIFRST